MRMEHTCRTPRAAWENDLACYLDACLRGAGEAPAYAGMRWRLAHCPACAAEVTEALALLQWREAETPFNAGALPLPVPGLGRQVSAAVSGRDG